MRKLLFVLPLLAVISCSPERAHIDDTQPERVLKEELINKGTENQPNNIQKLDSAFLVSEIEIRSKVISEEPSSDARGLANNEIEIYFLVNGMIICTITDFGEGFSGSQGSKFYVSSSIAEKKYEAKFLDNNVIITKTIFFDGNENIQWIRTYKSNWILTNCDGDC